MEFSILRIKHDRHTVAKGMARRLRNHPDEWLHWIHLSRSDALAWDTLMLLIKDLLDTAPGEYLLSPLALWAGEVAFGELKKPTAKGPDPYANLARNIAIVVTIEEICRLGIRKATASPGKRGGKRKSACHVVGSRLFLEYETIKTIWQDDRRRRTRSQGSPEEPRRSE